MCYVSTRQLEGKLRKFKRKFPQSVPPFTATMCTRVVTFRATRPMSAQKKPEEHVYDKNFRILVFD